MTQPTIARNAKVEVDGVEVGTIRPLPPPAVDFVEAERQMREAVAHVMAVPVGYLRRPWYWR